MLRQHEHDPYQKEINHEKPTQTYTCYEFKVILQECNEPVSLVAAGNNILVITDAVRNYPLCKEGFRGVCAKLLLPASASLCLLPQVMLYYSV